MEIERDPEQELEWNRAQNISISLNLQIAAKQQLQFLAIVDRNRWFHQSPALEKAIYRYNACWLPLLAQHTESPLIDGPLAVPLDCEWIWHCHRLNPIQYKSDCEELYGRILDCSNVISSTEQFCRKDTEIAWNTLFPHESYQFDAKSSKKFSANTKFSSYDFISASQRQTSFFYQVSQPHMKNDVFLEEAVARYKGFLHLKRRNNERSIAQFCVPTYDIDLIWHTHQLHPVFYCNDVTKALGEILGHDDSVTDRRKGMKLDLGFSATLKQWEETFGSRYWKAGGMNRGPPPPPVSSLPVVPGELRTEIPHGFSRSLNFSRFEMAEVFAELVTVKNLPQKETGFMVTIRKRKPDRFFSRKLQLQVPESGEEKRVTYFRCEPIGELYIQLRRRSGKTIGAASFCLDEFFTQLKKLAVEKWVELTPSNGKPIHLRIALSFTLPIKAPYKITLAQPCGFLGKLHLRKNWSHVKNQVGEKIITLQMRDGGGKKLVAGRRKSGKSCVLAEWSGAEWSMMDGQWSMKMRRQEDEGSHIAEVLGCRMLRLFEGPKLNYGGEYTREKGLITVVEFSSDDPYGKAIALIDLMMGYNKVNEDWFVLPGLVLAFILHKNSLHNVA